MGKTTEGMNLLKSSIDPPFPLFGTHAFPRSRPALDENVLFLFGRSTNSLHVLDHYDMGYIIESQATNASNCPLARSLDGEVGANHQLRQSYQKNN